MTKQLISLGLMSGTSGDGVDASIIQSDGEDHYKVLYDNYFPYNKDIFKLIHSLKDKIHNSNQLSSLNKDIKILEREITLFHANVVSSVINHTNQKIDLIGFHGQTIYHNEKEKISRQLGDAKLLFQLVNKKVVYNFRQNDLKNGGSGAPLSPIYHKLILKNNNFDLPLCVLNIGGISNITVIKQYDLNEIISKDIGPGNCMIDEWLRKNSKYTYDKDGLIAESGIINNIILEQAQELYVNRLNKNSSSLDTKDFDISFVRGLSLEDGVATLTEFTAQIIADALNTSLLDKEDHPWKILLCGGGRKNKTLIKYIKNKVSNNKKVCLIDNFRINGDYIESQAFAYLAIRSYLSLPISFPKTTGCLEACSGGEIISN